MKAAKRQQDALPENATDNLLNGLSYKDFPALRRARASLTVKSHDKKIDVFFCARISGMVGTLNLYLDPSLSYSWRECSLLVSKASGHGVH